MLKVERAAIRTEAGEVYSVPQPGRHHHVIALMSKSGCSRSDIGQAEQGFVLSDGRFVMRKAALRVAREAGQTIKEHAPQHGLFSEDVW